MPGRTFLAHALRRSQFCLGSSVQNAGITWALYLSNDSLGPPRTLSDKNKLFPIFLKNVILFSFSARTSGIPARQLGKQKAGYEAHSVRVGHKLLLIKDLSWFQA